MAKVGKSKATTRFSDFRTIGVIRTTMQHIVPQQVGLFDWSPQVVLHQIHVEKSQVLYGSMPQIDPVLLFPLLVPQLCSVARILPV